MSRRIRAFVEERKRNIDRRVGSKLNRRYFRCPACHRVHAIPQGAGLTKVICRHCGEIFLRRT